MVEISFGVFIFWIIIFFFIGALVGASIQKNWYLNCINRKLEKYGYKAEIAFDEEVK